MHNRKLHNHTLSRKKNQIYIYRCNFCIIYFILFCGFLMLWMRWYSKEKWKGASRTCGNPWAKVEKWFVCLLPYLPFHYNTNVSWENGLKGNELFFLLTQTIFIQNKPAKILFKHHCNDNTTSIWYGLLSL